MMRGAEFATRTSQVFHCTRSAWRSGSSTARS